MKSVTEELQIILKEKRNVNQSEIQRMEKAVAHYERLRPSKKKVELALSGVAHYRLMSNAD